MDTVCMALTHSETRIAVVDNSRDTVIVNRVYEEAPILPQIINGNLRDTITFFDKMARVTKTKNAELLISYPTNIGRLDCFESDYIDVDDYEKALPGKIYANLFLEKKEQFYVDWVMDTDREEGLYITAVAVARLFIDTLFNGAKSAGYRRISVEPESLAVLRLINDWQNVSYVLEVDANSSTITSFNPSKGLIVLPLLNLGSDRILGAADGISSLCQQLTLADLSTSKTFNGLDRKKVNIYVLCSNGANEEEIVQKKIAMESAPNTSAIKTTFKYKIYTEEG